jgi:hypothetical protein
MVRVDASQGVQIGFDGGRLEPLFAKECFENLEWIQPVQKASDTHNTYLADHFEVIDVGDVEANHMGALQYISRQPRHSVQCSSRLGLTCSPAAWPAGVGATFAKKTPASLSGPAATDCAKVDHMPSTEMC